MKPPIALVTGAGRGIGKSVASFLAADGVIVVPASRKDPPKGIPSLDVSDQSSVATMIEHIGNTYGRLDILINNAGVIAPFGKISETAPALWAQAVSTNLIGAFNMAHAALKFFESQGSGTIVNLSTGAARAAIPGWSAYCSAKAGLAMLTQCLHAEYGDFVRIYGYDPGAVDTGMQLQIRKTGIGPQVPVDKLFSEHRPAKDIAWLCRERPVDLAGKEIHSRSLAERLTQQRHPRPIQES